MCHCPSKSRQIGAPQAFFGRAVQDMNPSRDLRGLRQRIGKPACAVRGIVVDNQHVHPHLLFQHGFGKFFNVIRFIVGRHDHDCAGFRVF